MGELHQQLESAIGTLEGSPLFRLSMSSMELFHSNLLAWLLCQETSAGVSGRRIAAAILGDALLGPADTVWRERMKLDVIVEWNDLVIGIENKVKALPDEAQLARYRTRLVTLAESRRLECLLLTPLPSKPPIGWRSLSFGRLEEILSAEAASLERSSYARQLIEDYCRMLSGVISVATIAASSISDDTLLSHVLGEYGYLQPKGFHTLFFKQFAAAFVVKLGKRLRDEFGEDTARRFRLHPSFFKAKLQVRTGFVLTGASGRHVELGAEVEHSELHLFLEADGDKAAVERFANAVSHAWLRHDLVHSDWAWKQAKRRKKSGQLYWYSQKTNRPQAYLKQTFPDTISVTEAIDRVVACCRYLIERESELAAAL